MKAPEPGSRPGSQAHLAGHHAIGMTAPHMSTRCVIRCALRSRGRADLNGPAVPSEIRAPERERRAG